MLITFDTLQLLVVSLIPLGVYLILLGLVNVLGRPVVLTGRVDSLLLSLAISGLMVTGSISLLVEATPLYRLYTEHPSLPWLLYLLLAAAWVYRSGNYVVVYCTSPQALEEAIRLAAGGMGQQLRPAAGKGKLVLHPAELLVELRPFEALDAATVYVSDRSAVGLLACELRRAYRQLWQLGYRAHWSLAAVLFTVAGSILVAYPTAWLLR